MTISNRWQRQAAVIVLLTLGLLVCLATAAAAKTKTSKGSAKTSSKTTEVTLDTTRGKIVLTVHPDWAPIGAAHFLELVNAKFYDGAPWFRVIDGFVAQCGVAADPKMNAKWMDKTIKDEPLLKGNQRAMVAFGKSGMPNSRSTHIFINLNNNSGSLDPQGFSCFAEVTKGMDVADKLTRCEFGDQGGLSREGGMKSFKAAYPKADYIKTARVTKGGGKSKSKSK
jgi:cyclophilin family peptidyl-prolyl cis-trans isomerase